MEAVLYWPVPKTVYDVRAFLGFVGYYRRFIKDFSKIALPLRKLLIGLESQGKKAAKHTPADWGEEEQNAFDNLKSLCCKAPILMLHYLGVCHTINCPLVFQQRRVPNSLLMGVNSVDYEPQGTEVIMSTYRLTLVKGG